MAKPYPQVDGALLTDLLNQSGLARRDLAATVGALAATFPVRLQHDLFLEYELGVEATPAGFGLGFPAGMIDHFVAVQHPFLASSAGVALLDTLAANPFADDPGPDLNIFSDCDPDWVEYDIASDVLGHAPFVFFRPPSRMMTIGSSSELEDFVSILPSASAAFRDMMGLMLGEEGFRPYRLGVSTERGPGWWRLVVTNLEAWQVTAALTGVRGGHDLVLLDAAEKFYNSAFDSEGARFALSVDITNDRITAIDVECPYLFRASDPRSRVAPLREFVDDLTGEGRLTRQASDWICTNTDRSASIAGGVLGIQLHHLKFRVFGEPLGRAKAYLLLDLVPGVSAAP